MQNTAQTSTSFINLDMPLSVDITVDTFNRAALEDAFENGEDVVIADDVREQALSISINNFKEFVKMKGYVSAVGVESIVVDANAMAGAYDVNFVIDIMAETTGWDEFMADVTTAVQELVF